MARFAPPRLSSRRSFSNIGIGADFAAVAAPVAEILFFGAWINGLAFVPYGLLQSQGRPDVTGKFHTAEVLPFIGILWGLTSAFGIIGAALAWSLRCVADAACLFWAAGMPRRALLQAIVLPLLLLTSSAVLAPITESSLLEALGAATVTGLTGVTLAMVMAQDLKTFMSAAWRAVRLLRRIARAEM
jgi:O-antigen/teichoic acid export membrane protein